MKILIFLSVVLFIPSQAFALSCAEPTFDKKTIESVAIIFEGHVIESYVQQSDHTKITTQEDSYFVFKVTKAWKGIEPEQTVTIHRNTYWGDTFAMEGTYLVVAQEAKSSSEKKIYVSPLCGNTTHKDYADDKIKVLEQYFKDKTNEINFLKIQGEVLKNERNCKVDGTWCTIILSAIDAKEKGWNVVYHLGETPCDNEQASSIGSTLKEGDQIEVYGRKRGICSISVCDSKDSYIRKLSI